MVKMILPEPGQRHWWGWLGDYDDEEEGENQDSGEIDSSLVLGPVPPPNAWKTKNPCNKKWSFLKSLFD